MQMNLSTFPYHFFYFWYITCPKNKSNMMVVGILVDNASNKIKKPSTLPNIESVVEILSHSLCPFHHLSD